jgi:hypothetical protein
MKLTTALVALGLAIAAPARAADAPVLDWIIVAMDASQPADKAAVAMVEPWRYDYVGCVQEKGRFEGVVAMQFPKAHYIVFCAQVPGLSR